eukprot:3161136-Pyramimonas_sp.AAC.1
MDIRKRRDGRALYLVALRDIGGGNTPPACGRVLDRPNVCGVARGPASPHELHLALVVGEVARHGHVAASRARQAHDDRVGLHYEAAELAEEGVRQIGHLLEEDGVHLVGVEHGRVEEVGAEVGGDQQLGNLLAVDPDAEGGAHHGVV